MRLSLFILVIIAFISCNNPAENHQSGTTLSPNITTDDIHAHIRYLTGDSLKGRKMGSAGEAMAARYIADQFNAFGLQPLGDDSTYYQQFIVTLSSGNNRLNAHPSAPASKKRISRNVIGLLKGRSMPDTYIVIGAHYNRLKKAQTDSLTVHKGSQVQNEADGNASGTSGMLELAQYFSSHPPEKSLIFIAFSGEDSGVKHFIDAPSIPLPKVQAVLNIGLIDRLQNGRLSVFGTGSSDDWPSLITKANTDSLKIRMIPGGLGVETRSPFYKKNIPGLYYFTRIHTTYHHPSDDTSHINFEGESRILNHLSRVVKEIDTLTTNKLEYKKVPSNHRQNFILKGPVLGVMPDYGFNGIGMRITRVNKGGPAYTAGLQSGDIIIQLKGKKLKDIYTYMDVLSTLKKGEKTTVTVKRNNQEHTFDIKL